MTRFFALMTISALGLLLAGCTLTPHSGADDLLETGHVTEHQDPVTLMSGPYSNTMPEHKSIPSPAKAAPEKLSSPPAAKTPVVEETKVPLKPVEPAKSPEVKAPEVKTSEVKTPAKMETPAEKPVAKVEAVTPPAAPAGCGGTASNSAPSATTDTAMTAAKAPDMPKRSVFEKGDKVKVTVFREKDLTGEYQIDDKGDITLPLIGHIAAAGSNSIQLQEKLKDALSKGYLVNPDVMVEFPSGCTTK